MTSVISNGVMMNTIVWTENFFFQFLEYTMTGVVVDLASCYATDL